MQNNKNGIRIDHPRKKHRNRKAIEGMDLNTTVFKLKSKEFDVQVVIPVFSPVLELMRKEGWEEIYD